MKNYKKLTSIVLSLVLVFALFTPIYANAKMPDVICAVIDTGLDITHPVFADRIVKPMNFTGDSSRTDVTDYHGHGTHIAGVIANNTKEVNVKIMPLKVVSPTTGSSVANLIKAINYAVDNGADVINISLETSKDRVSYALTDAIYYAKDKGCVIVASAGNNGKGVSAPACLDGVIAVGAVGYRHGVYYKASFSNYDENTQILYARGVSVLSAYPNNMSGITGTQGEKYAYKSGTSIASAFVSSTACLLKANGSKSVYDELYALSYRQVPNAKAILGYDLLLDYNCKETAEAERK